MLIMHSVGFSLENTILVAEFRVLIRIDIRPISSHLDQTSFVNKGFLCRKGTLFFLT